MCLGRWRGRGAEPADGPTESAEGYPVNFSGNFRVLVKVLKKVTFIMAGVLIVYFDHSPFPPLRFIFFPRAYIAAAGRAKHL